MRIAYLVNAPRTHLTGAAIRALTLAAGASARGDSAVVIGPGGSGLERAARERGLRFEAASFSASLGSWRRLRRILSRIAPDVIHAMSTAPMALARPSLLLARATDGTTAGARAGEARFVSVVVDPTSAEVFADGRSRPATMARRNRLLVRISRALDGVFAISEPVRERLVELGVTGVVTLGGAAIDAEELSRRAREPIALPHGHPRIGSAVGQLEPLKGVDVLLRAFAGILAEHPDAICLIAGEGSHRRELELLAENLGIANHVRFLGYLDEPAPLLAALDLHVSPSRSEGLGTATAQAMALGVPVIATAVGGSSDVVTDGVTGLLVPPEDVDALTAAMRELLGDPQRARELAEKGRADVVARHSVAGFADATWEQYARALGGGR